MSQILSLYSHLLTGRERFIDEVFYDEIYKDSRPKLTVVDIGAYQGEYSFYCLPFANKIYAIEPDPRPFAVLKKTVTKFELESIKIYPLAISGEDGQKTLHASGYGGSKLSGSSEVSVGDVTVDTLTLNNFFLREGIEHVDILKIDCESSEEQIFNAPDFPEAANKIKYIIGEDHGGGQFFLNKLPPLGFTVKSVANNTWEARR